MTTPILKPADSGLDTSSADSPFSRRLAVGFLVLHHFKGTITNSYICAGEDIYIHIYTHTHIHTHMILAHSTAWMHLGNMLVSEVSRHKSADSVLSPHLCEEPRTRRHTEMEEQRFPGLE